MTGLFLDAREISVKFAGRFICTLPSFILDYRLKKYAHFLQINFIDCPDCRNRLPIIIGNIVYVCNTYVKVTEPRHHYIVCCSLGNDRVCCLINVSLVRHADFSSLWAC